MKLKKLIKKLIKRADSYESMSQGLMNVKNQKGKTYQVQLVVTREETELLCSTSLPDMKIKNGKLVEDF